MTNQPGQKLTKDQLTALIGDLSPEQRELFEILLKEQGLDISDSIITPQTRYPDPDGQGYRMPLSYAQQRIWFLDEWDPGSILYNIPAAVRLIGNLRVDILARTINEVIRRHEILRTTFGSEQGQPYQTILAEMKLDLPVIDLQHLPVETRLAEMRRLAEREAKKSFDLKDGPLLRASLIKMGEQDYVALLGMHHIIADGWSIGVLLQEIAVLYEAFSDGKESPLPGLTIQYADYSVWQKKWLNGDTLDQQLAYWKDKLAGSLTVLELPKDRVKIETQSIRGASQSFSLSRDISRQLRELSQAESTTLFMTLLAAYQTLLYRYSGQSDICVGVPVANRTRSELEGLIGFFVNTLVLRSDLSDEPSYRELLAQVRETTLGAFAHQDLPFEMLVEKLQPERDMEHSPLFQVMFVLQNAPMSARRLPGLTMSNLPVDSGTAKFELTLIMAEEADRITGVIEYKSDLYNQDTILRMIENFKVLLAGLGENPDQKISKLPILTDGEYQQLIVEWNNTAPLITWSLEGLNRTIPELFSEQAQQTPDAFAVVGKSILSNWDHQSKLHILTYDLLDRRSNQLARHLVQFGLKPDALIGLLVERSVEMIVGLLGILKAGAAYLPLDPAYPIDRLKFIMEDAHAEILITQQSLAASVPIILGQQKTILIDAEWESSIGLEDDASFKYPGRSDNLAYVIYTSGSTGRPKGVMIEHNTAINLWVGLSQAIYANHLERDLTTGFPRLDSQKLRITLNAPLLFDASVQQWLMLLSGHCLYVLPQEIRQDVQGLVNFIRQNQIDVIDCVPTQLKLMLDGGLFDGGDWKPRAILPGGEAIDSKTWDTLVQVSGILGVEFYNMYGPTECTVDSTICQVRKNPDQPSIGRPIINAQMYVLDRYLQPVPIGVTGELYIGGSGVGRGYLNRRELTTEYFLPNPYHVGRMYRTGDLVHYLPNGYLVYKGRKDDQVKVRGFRIELGEIEANLGENQDLKEVVVVARKDSQGAEQLVAFVVPQEGKSLDSVQMREHSRDRLPEYMVPSVFVILDALPLTPNGKVDRKKLVSMSLVESDRLVSQRDYIEPRNQIEHQLAEMWGFYLGIETIGAFDNFFELGGHSLLATQLVSRIREVFKINYQLRNLFESPTLAGMAETIQSAILAGMSVHEEKIKPVPRDPLNGLPLDAPPLSFAQQRLWFLEQFSPGTANYNIPAAIRMVGELNIAALEASLHEIIKRHEIIRTRIFTVGGRPVLSVLAQVDFRISIEDLTDPPVAAREKIALELALDEARQPFDLFQAPLIRARLIKLGECDHLALLTMHHIISDGWSTGVLIRELAALYPIMVEGKGPEFAGLSELSIQYADYAAWQRNWLQGEALLDQINYWRERLAGSSPLLELPTDRPRPAVQTMNGDQVSFEIGLDLTRDLEALSRKEGVTLFMTLMTAFQTLLYRYSGQDDISVGTPIANRTQVDIEPLIGFFVNTLVMRADLSGGPSFKELLQRGRETALGAYAHQDVPFEMLVNEIQPERDTSHSPLFQVMFVLQNVPSQTLRLPDLSLTAVEVTTGVSKYDMTLTMAPGPSGLGGVVEFNSDLFDRSTIVRMIGHLRVLMQHLVTDPLQAIDVLPLLSEGERKVLLENWTATDRTIPSNSSLMDLFEEQVARAPEAPALIGKSILNPDSQEITILYAELNQRANQLASHLVSLGVKSETLVGLQIERSVEMIISLLAILKAGAAYLPLDPAYPADRLAFIMLDAQVNVLITQEKFLDILGETADREVDTIVLDRDWDELFSNGDRSNPTRIASPNSLAYVIYTSGSTGRPKGVMIEQKSVINLWAGLSQVIYANHIEIDPESYLPIGESQPMRVSLNAPLMFDASVQEWVMLLSGHCLVIVPQEARQDGESLLAYVRERQIDILDCVPSQLKLMIAAGLMDGNGFTPRAILPGGEAIDAHTWEIISRSEKIQFYNMYGPTECTVDSTICWINKYPTVPIIGLPVANVKLYVLDQKLQPVPVGVPGELFIAGGGVGRGYLNRPDLSSERFLSNPFVRDSASIAEPRMYRTGDLVRYLPDGYLEFIGRVDDQVKLRGFRIELGEIEATLLEHPGVREAAVLIRENRSGEKQLVAYLSRPQAEDNLTVGDLRDFLKSKLPDYMVPSVFVLVSDLPLTPNAKVDRKVLAARPIEDELRARVETEYIAPRTQSEAALAGIWRELLGHETIGIHDNFFELGGDSILSIQVTARANQAGLHISPRDLFENQTIEKLAAVATTDRMMNTQQGLVTGEVSLTPIQSWFFQQDFLDKHHWNQVLFVQVLQPLEKPILERVVDQLLKQHDALCLIFEQSDHGWRQENDGLPFVLPFEIVELGDQSDDEQIRQIEWNANRIQASLNLEQGPLMRVAYFTLGADQPGRLLIVIHHLVVDGVSWHILMEDFQAIYAQLATASNLDIAESKSPDVILPPKTTSYQYWATALEKYAQSEELGKQLDYWLGVSEGEFLELPYDFNTGANDEESVEKVTISLTKDETTSLLKVVPSAYQTEINDVLLAALARSFTTWTQEKAPSFSEEDRAWFLVALEGHGREDIFPEVDLSRTVGWFTTIYPIRLESTASGRRWDTPDDHLQENPGETLKSVKEMLRRVPQHGIGYSLLRYSRQSDSPGHQGKTSPLARTKQPEISFNYLGQVRSGRSSGIPDEPLGTLAIASGGQEMDSSSIFAPALESAGSPHSPRARRAYEIEIIGQVAGGQLSLDWLYSRNRFEKASVELFASLYHDALRLLIQHCLAPEVGGYTPSDFSLAGLDQAKLDKMLQKLSHPKKKGS